MYGNWLPIIITKPLKHLFCVRFLHWICFNFFAVESISNIDGSIFDDKSALQKAREEKVTVQFLFHVKYEDFRPSQFYLSEDGLTNEWSSIGCFCLDNYKNLFGTFIVKCMVFS